MNNRVIAVVAATFAGIVGAIIYTRAQDRTKADANGRSASVREIGPALSVPEQSAGAPKQPPRLREEPNRLPADPASPSYNPVALVKLNVPAKQLFEAEPRDGTWAPPMEKRLETLLGADLEVAKIDVKMADVECRTAMCRFVLTAPDKETLRAAMTMTANYTPLANVITMDPVDAPNKVGVLLAYDPDFKEPATQQKLYEQLRPQWLARARMMRKPTDPPVPEK